MSLSMLQPARAKLNELALNALLYPTNISFSHPYDPSSYLPLNENIKPRKLDHLSYASPMTDFTSPSYLEGMPRVYTITEALAPSSEAKVLTSADESFSIQHVNEAWTRLCGYSSNESNGKTLQMLQGDETDKDTIKDLTLLLRQGNSVDAVLLNCNKHGRMFQNKLTINPVTSSETGKITNYIGTLKEINTNNKQYAAALC